MQVNKLLKYLNIGFKQQISDYSDYIAIRIKLALINNKQQHHFLQRQRFFLQMWRPQ